MVQHVCKMIKLFYEVWMPGGWGAEPDLLYILFISLYVCKKKLMYPHTAGSHMLEMQSALLLVSAIHLFLTPSSTTMHTKLFASA